MTSADSGADAPARLTARITGRVQGVGFRWLTAQRAEARSLVGRATNLPDGSVEVVAEGPRNKLQELLDWLRSPSAPGRVGNVQADWTAATGEFRRFSTG